MEMIIVIIIITIIFLLTIPNIAKLLNSVKDKGCDVQLKIVESAMLSYHLDYDEFPYSVNDLINAGYLEEKQGRCPNGKEIYLNDNKAYAD